MLSETPIEGDDEAVGYLPSIDINRMNVAMLLSRLDEAGSEAFKIDRDRYNAPWEALTKARVDFYDHTEKILLKDL
jgi:membrane protein